MNAPVLKYVVAEKESCLLSFSATTYFKTGAFIQLVLINSDPNKVAEDMEHNYATVTLCINVSTNAAVLELHCFANERMTAETRQLARAERRCDHIALADKRGARASERASERERAYRADGKPSSTTLSAAEN